jgi:hypothetical protein
VRPLLEAFAAHLAGAGWPVAVGAQPDGAPSLYAYVTQTSARIGGTIDAGSLDADRDPQLHVKIVGRSAAQVLELAGRLETRARTFTHPGLHTLTVELQVGPSRDTDVHPDRPAWWVDVYWRATTGR